MIDGTLARACVANAKDDRQQLAVSQSLGTILEQFSLGRSFAGHSLMLVGYRLMVPHQVVLRLLSEFRASARRPLYHNGGLVQYSQDKPF